MIDKPLSYQPGSFPETHCMKCQGGFLQTMTDGQITLLCLVNRQPVPPKLARCNKFEEAEV